MKDRDEQDIKKKMGEGMSDSGRSRESQPGEKKESESQRGTGMNERGNQGGRGGMRDEMGRDE